MTDAYSASENSVKNEDAQQYTYEAFISYRHLPRDTEAAKQVQKTIEGFRLPRGLKRCGPLQNAAAEPSRTLGKCFRDEDELASSPSLPESIHKALAESNALIVICSPDTAKSAWVQREIETYIGIHGRDRVVAVLASGSSDESIPLILRNVHKDGMDVSGELHEPLAADLRPDSAAKRKAELLRVVAAVAGCGYDDLVRRQQKRRRRRIASAIAAAIVLAAIVCACVLVARDASEERLVAESKQLAALSAQQLSEGDRISAIRTALQALHNPEDGNARPYVEDAQVALENALQLNPASDGIWRPSYVFDASSEIASFVSDTSGDWGAVMDTAGKVSVFDIRTGSLRNGFELSGYSVEGRQVASDEWKMTPVGKNRLLIGNREGNGSFACLDCESGSTVWEYEAVKASSIAVSEDGTRAAVFTVEPGVGLLVALFDASTGEALEWSEFEVPGIQDLPVFTPSYLNSDGTKAFLGHAGFLFAVDFVDGVLNTAQLNDLMTWSVDGYGSDVVSAASGRPADAVEFTYKVTAVDGQPVEKWSIEGIASRAVAGNPYQTVTIEGYPSVCGFIGTEESNPCAVISVGDTIKVIRLLDGTEVYSEEFSHLVVGVGVCSVGGGKDMVYIAISDGTLDVRMPFLDVKSYGDSLSERTPYDIVHASLEWYEGEDLIALSQVVDPPGRIVAFRMDSRAADEAADYSLDEMIAMAHELVDAA